MRYWLNPRPRQVAEAGLFTNEDYREVAEFYAAAEPTPLVALPGIAQRIGIGELWVKDESRRMGMNAFKILGVDWAMERLERGGRLAGVTTLVCSTDGNHGRAVARAARK